MLCTQRLSTGPKESVGVRAVALTRHQYPPINLISLKVSWSQGSWSRTLSHILSAATRPPPPLPPLYRQTITERSIGYTNSRKSQNDGTCARWCMCTSIGCSPKQRLFSVGRQRLEKKTPVTPSSIYTRGSARWKLCGAFGPVSLMYRNRSKTTESGYTK